MPRFTFKCERCGDFDEVVPSVRDSVDCPTCGGRAMRVFTPCANTLVPGYMKASNDDSRYRAWFNSDATQAKIRSGQLEIDRSGDEE